MSLKMHGLSQVEKSRLRAAFFLFIFQYFTAAVEKFLFSILIFAILACVAERFKPLLAENLIDADGNRV